MNSLLAVTPAKAGVQRAEKGMLDPRMRGDDNIAMVKAHDFDLTATLESGQVFGFKKIENRFQGIISETPVELWKESENLFVKGEVPEPEIKRYFDLERDLTEVYAFLKEHERLAECAGSLKGLRIIRQNPWEALSAFIISSNNNIKRIQLIWNRLHTLSKSSSFPSASEIAASNEAELRILGLGYRAPFLLKTSRRISEDPLFLSSVVGLNYEEAKMKLMELDGVGGKVADCVLLFGFHKYEAFPVDVWISRIMKKLYFRNRNVSEEKILKFAQKRWKNLAGYVQQYLFHGARQGLI